MGFVIVCSGLRGRMLSPDGVVPVGWYLREYDPEYEDGLGRVVWTQDLTQAKRFPTLGMAVRCYQAVPRSRPLRDDGEVCRPLTALAVEFVDTATLTPGNLTVTG